jgi:hypothetical protein
MLYCVWGIYDFKFQIYDLGGGYGCVLLFFEEIIGYRKRNRQTIKSIIKKTQETH